MDVAALAFEGDDRVGDQLAGPVPGDVAAPGDAADAVSGPLQLGRCDAEVRGIRPPARGVDTLVLEQEQGVRHGLGDPPGVELLLQLVRVVVADAPEPGCPTRPSYEGGTWSKYT